MNELYITLKNIAERNRGAIVKLRVNATAEQMQVLDDADEVLEHFIIRNLKQIKDVFNLEGV